MDEIILYSTHCPVCLQLERVLMKKGISFVLCEDMEEMKRIGLKQAPALSINGEILKAPQAMKWALGAK